MTSAQFAWKQFSANHIQREGGAHEHRDLADDREERFDMPVPITASRNSKTSTTSTKSKRIQFSTTGHLIDTNNRNNLMAATAATTSPAAGFEQVKKAKTRSERRAEEPDIVEQADQEPVQRRERRSDYWVQRDDMRRGNARTMKNQFQNFEEWINSPRLQDRIGFRWVVYNETFFIFYSSRRVWVGVRRPSR